MQFFNKAGFLFSTMLLYKSLFNYPPIKAAYMLLLLTTMPGLVLGLL